MVFRVDAPASAAGTYSLLRSSFGPTDVNEILDKPIKLSDPANPCGGVTNDLTGTIAFVDRGSCTAPNQNDGNFIAKVRHAAAAGAIAVIVCNNENAPVNPGLPAGEVDDVTIKSFLLTKPECDKIKLALNSGTVNGNIILKGCVPQPPSNAIWGTNPGEGDFKDGLNDWTITNAPGEGFLWSATGDCAGSFLPNPCFAETPTVCNGLVSITSSTLNQTGVCSPCPSGLISPNIDLSNVDIEGLTLQFNQSVREYYSEYYVYLSYDNGLTWEDTIEINRDLPVNSPFYYNQLMRVALCDAASDIQQLRVQFFTTGNYYYWGIDDVFLINEVSADPQVNTNFWAVPPTIKTPVSQAAEFPLLSDIRNNGASPSENTVLTATIKDLATSEVVYSQENNYETVDKCEQIENVVFENFAVQPTKVGTYEIAYQIDSDNNSVPENDIRASVFEMTENTFSNAFSEAELNSNYMRGWAGWFADPAGVVGSGVDAWSVGTHYYFPNGAKYNAKVKEYRFGVDDDAEIDPFSAILKLSVYKLLDQNADGAITPEEKVLVGIGTSSEDGSEDYFIESSTPNLRSLYFNVQSTDGSDLTLEDNTGYIFVLHISQFSGEDYFPVLGFSTDSENYTLRSSYTAATFLGFEQAGINRYFNTLVSSGATSNDNLDDRTMRSINSDNKHYSELLIEADVVSTKDEVLAENALNVYPNPTSDKLYVDMNLSKVSKEVKVNVYGIDGRLVLTQNFENIRTETLKINTHLLNSGVYTAKVITDEGSTTKKVLVSK